MKKIISLLLALVLLAGALCVTASASNSTIDRAVSQTAAYLLQTVTDPQCASIGGEYAVIGLARSGCDVPQSWIDRYYSNLEQYVKDCGGVLHRRKYTEYSRVVLGVTAIGKDPTDIAGYDILAPLGDYDKTIWQGNNGAIWALLAFNSGNYAMPANATATRDMYINRLIECEISGGGWAIDPTVSLLDVDITAMAVQALAPYYNGTKSCSNPAGVKACVDRALAILASAQNADGSFSEDIGGTSSSETTAQVVVALATLGRDPAGMCSSSGKSAIDGLLAFSLGNGAFSHVIGGDADGMSTEQAFYALVAAQRYYNGSNALYDMTDIQSAPEPLPFTDVRESDWFYGDVKFVYENKLFSGTGDTVFAPYDVMTRAMFVTVLYRLEGQPSVSASNPFTDVANGQWYTNAILWASSTDVGGGQMLVGGYGDGIFGTNDTITREQIATLMYRYAAYKGRNVGASADLSRYTDAGSISEYALSAMRWANSVGLITGATSTTLEPKTNATRAVVAAIFHRYVENI